MSAAKASRTRRGQVREAAVLTSRSLIAESGVEALSVAEVARRLGVSTAAPYRHFPDRAALLSAVLADVASDLVNAVTAAAASAPDPEDAFLLAVDAYARHVVATRVGLPELFGARARELPGDVLAETRGRLVDELIVAVSTRGARNRNAAARIVQDVLAAVSGLVTAYLAGALEPGTDLESVAASAVELARAMAPRPRRRPASAAPSLDAPASVVDDDQPALF